MKSTEKVRRWVDWALDLTDADLAEMLPFPIPSGMVRMAIGKAEEMLPPDPEAIDALIDQGLEFLGALKSDET